MAAVRRTGSSKSAIALSDLATALTDAVIGAKRVLDETTAKVADQYRSNRVLRHLAPPSFAIGEVRFTIKFAIARIGPQATVASRAKPGQVYVYVDAASLGDIEPHLISETELRIVPDVTRAQSTDAERSVPE